MKTLDNEIFLSIFHLKKLGVLLPGSSTTLTWSCGDTVVQKTKIFIDEDGVDMVGGKIYFDSTPCHFGGERLWLLCPTCYRRRGVLYGADFACNKCLDLSYGCQHESKLERVQRKLRRFTYQAFDSASPWVKPKYQHHHTYLDNLGKYCELQIQKNQLICK